MTKGNSDRVLERSIVKKHYITVSGRHYLDRLEKPLTLSQTTNFRLFQTERVCRRQFSVSRKWQKVLQQARKLNEKEKLLVTSNFSFSHSVFKRLVKQIRKTQGFLERVNPFPNKPWFLLVCNVSPLKTLWEKEKSLTMSNFSFSHSVF